MAGNKINTKNKGKEDKTKATKNVTQSNEDSEELDFALLRKPIHTSITGFAQARKIFDLATEELKDLLSNECDVLYECKVCRNIFRSLANFISHKRVYCKEKFNSTVHGHFIKTASTLNELLKIKQTEQGYQASIKNKNAADIRNEEEEDQDRVPLSRDLTTVVEKITQTKAISVNNNDEPRVVLQKIPCSSVAVFQNMDYNHSSDHDNMRAQVKELDNILSRDKAVLQSDGKFVIESSQENNKPLIESENVIQISDDDETENVLKCKICDLQFSTQKTLKFHMKHKHLESRIVYPCPDCFEIFSTSWSVYRHLFKVHRKTAAQIRRLRESIQAKAFRMNNPPAFYEKRKNVKQSTPQKITEEERLDQENQAWMDNMEGDGEVPRCGGCGRTFERRAALAAHTHTCQPRSRALAAARRPDTKKIEIQIRKDYNKGPVTGLTIHKCDATGAYAIDNKPSGDVQLGSKRNDTAKTADSEEKKLEDEAPMDIGDDEQKSNDSADCLQKEIEDNSQLDIPPDFKLPFALQAEKSNLAAFKQRILPEIELAKTLCKKCDTKFNSAAELYEHMAGHFKWMRYACKLCNFKHYNFDKLPEHVKVIHKLKGDTDFYFSTVKAVDGTEAMILSRCLVESESTDETNDTNETSPESRRPSRCSSDSSRLSDDSSSSSTIKEGTTRKRKIYQNKTNAKRKKESLPNDDDADQKNGDVSIDNTTKVILDDKESTTNIKTVEENSSDMEDIEEKNTKRHNIGDTYSVASRRPVRKKTKPKNEDFEYDLSNLLKMEAQGYRDSQSNNQLNARLNTNTKSNQNKKKSQPETNNESYNKDYCGALATLSKKAVENGQAILKTICFVNSAQKEQRSTSMFVRPMVPKTFSRSDKPSPKKDIVDESSPSKILKTPELDPNISNIEKKSCEDVSKQIESDELPSIHKVDKRKVDINETKDIAPSNCDSSSIKEHQDSDSNTLNKIKTNLSIPAVVPLKFRRQSLEVMKNPIINKNITDFTKAGMKTKILVIKPINRSKEGGGTVNTPLKYQTITLKDPNKKTTSSEDKASDQVVVVKVPKVDHAIPRTTTETSTTNSDKLVSSDINDSSLNRKTDNNPGKSDNTVVSNENKGSTDNSEQITKMCDSNDTRTLVPNSDSPSDEN